jgi:hypothetical protein
MSKLAIFVAVAGLLVTGVTAASAAPITPTPAIQIAGSSTEITDVQWGRHCWRDRWGRVQCRGAAPGWGPRRHCWRDRWGRVICR